MNFPSFIFFLKREKLLGINTLSIILSIFIIFFSLEKYIGFFNLFSEKIDVFLTLIIIIFSFLIPITTYFFSVISWYTEKNLDKSNEDQDSVLEKKINNLSKQLNRIEAKIINKEINNKIEKKTLIKESLIQKEIPKEHSTKVLRNLDLDKNQSLPDWELLIRALNFPNNINDQIGFRALKIAKKHKHTNDLLLSAEDVMTLLSQNGVYLDDHDFYPTNDLIWINFIRNENINKNKSLICSGHEKIIEILSKRKIEDIIFKDTMLTFLRRFDQFLRQRSQSATDENLFHLFFTRSGKAFILIGKLYKIF